MKYFFAILFSCAFSACALAGNGYDLWLRYLPVKNKSALKQYRSATAGVTMPDQASSTMKAIQHEFERALPDMLNLQPVFGKQLDPKSRLIIARNETVAAMFPEWKYAALSHPEAYRIQNFSHKKKNYIIISGATDQALLYGSFHLLRLMGQEQPLPLLLEETPAMDVRVLNHWDNLDRSVERGYAGSSIWDWHTLPGYLNPRYTDYARANASIGINGTVLTNVNANALVLSAEYIQKVKALAGVFRPYGIKVYLTARFSAPMELGKLKTADPLDPAVKEWWAKKAAEIYREIPDFGGFLVKANSEGQPGPQNYGRTHVDGANMMADAVRPFGGIVMWRAFVYSNETPDDRINQAYNEFQPFDGKFRPNVLVQVKNGPLDFQPREPFHPLFGAMPKTPLMMEFQLTQEYLGFSTHLAYLPSLQKEVLDAPTYTQGKPNPVKQIISTPVSDSSVTGIAGVANIGSDVNWTGHPFGQANWYAFGRLAWNPDASEETLASEWVRLSFGNMDEEAEKTIVSMMLASREAVVNYMTPLGLTHIMGNGHHYGPSPWSNNLPRADWNPVYYHRADADGIGFDRTASGSNALAQYSPEVAKQWADPDSCEEEFLLWFHHLPWDFKMRDGTSLWNKLCLKYQQGVNEVRTMRKQWDGLEEEIEPRLFTQVAQLLAVQEKEAVWWKNACLLYFQTFSKKPFPEGVETPDQTLEYYKSLRFPFAPGNG